ncbi:MAG: transcriptional regulator, AraC family, partial [Akkermansiaceae bacterium]|nr:transcriptional regulator, AraC family [Akkermansiaceae bacterium]
QNNTGIKNTMIPEDDFPLMSEEIERWPALGFYLSVLEHLAPGAVGSGRGSLNGESQCAADAWCVEIPRSNERWFVSVDPAKANPPGGRPPWRNPAILDLLEAMRKNLATAPKLHAAPPAVRSAWSLLIGHPTRPMSVAEVAAAVDLSAGHLGERFEEIIGTSFRRTMRDERIATSIRQLEGSYLRISEIAGGLGGQSLSQFNRNFVAATGITPSQWRERFSQSSAPRKQADAI